ncbi:hypothetical protein BS50DRAFT_578453 [Corynespora cassiicola Philippines]|uniref:Ent-kaurene synthase n=1 Tax=Corynespora cassiicola Philippines TaxID=1448308 RepID=A0A2T2N7M6_CORCC|nr:hypothetical protein BS50DRAFT_578453 [Corynespora cassiicola Philippines]
MGSFHAEDASFGAEGKKGIDMLVARMLQTYDSRYGLGYMSCSVYDTAWVANVTKTVAGIPQYLFPLSFLAILNAQLPDGSWGGHFHRRRSSSSSSSSSSVTSSKGSTWASKEASYSFCDAILSTMASLYTLILHSKHSHQIPEIRLPAPSLDVRISNAVDSLKAMLPRWRIGECNAVGFEVLAPALLDLLSTQGYEFEFPDRVKLLKVRDAKLSRINLEHLHRAAPSALLHSLEAFHGTDGLDMSKFKHHLVGGSMMASPAATASYLMKSNEWDDSAEAYLRLVVERGDGQGSGAVPSAYPSTNFEMLWVVSTLAEFHVWCPSEGGKWTKSILSMIEQSKSQTNGLVGFAPGIEPDLDDSSKASTILSLIQNAGFSEAIVAEFDGPRCLRTYRGERDPSVSANCNALMSLLMDNQDFADKSSAIEKAVVFVHDAWTDAEGELLDKWNLSIHYPVMLLSRSLTELVLAWTSGRLAPRLDRTMTAQAVPLLVKAALQTLCAQHPDGSWGSMDWCEETAYAVLSLVSFLSLPLPVSLRVVASHAVERGRAFLQRGGHEIGFLWIEKITYRSELLREAYVQTALHAVPERLWRMQEMNGRVLELAGMLDRQVRFEEGRSDSPASPGESTTYGDGVVAEAIVQG